MLRRKRNTRNFWTATAIPDAATLTANCWISLERSGDKSRKAAVARRLMALDLLAGDKAAASRDAAAAGPDRAARMAGQQRHR